MCGLGLPELDQKPTSSETVLPAVKRGCMGVRGAHGGGGMLTVRLSESLRDAWRCMEHR